MALKTDTAEKKQRAKETLRAWRKKNPGKNAKYQREYWARHPGQRNKSRIARDENWPAGPGKPETYACKKCGETKIFTRVFFPPKYDNKWRLGYECRTCSNAVFLIKNSILRYGISKEEVERLRSIEYCEICGKKEKLHIDHCHKTKLVRGVLCRGCNRGLGFFNEDDEAMAAAIQYIQFHRIMSTYRS